MKHLEFNWSQKPFVHAETGLPDTEPLALKAMAVLLKHFLVPFADTYVADWRSRDHFRHRLAELEEMDEDVVLVKPWIVGEHMVAGEEVVLFQADDPLDEAFHDTLRQKFDQLIHHSQHNTLLGVYLVVQRADWKGVFAFRLEPGGECIRHLPVTQALCLELQGEASNVSQWLNWAYATSS